MSMFTASAKTIDNTPAVRKASDDSSLESLSRIGFEVRKEIVESIESSASPSRPGDPIHTRRGLARRAMRYAVDKPNQNVVIGPRFSAVGRSIEPHEHGGPYKGVNYPARPTAEPALARVAPRIGPMFKH
jgi:hypothetical protein